MKRTGCLSIFVFYSLASHAQYKTSIKRIYSINVKDSFDIYISAPEGPAPEKYDEIIYYLDASLRSGKTLRQLAEADKINLKRKIVYVGIGHIGNYHQLRRRDFILPFIRNGDTIPRSSDYGQIDLFYRFMRSELIPLIDHDYASAGRRSIVGHSLGGLFAVYCFFRNEGLFNKYFALSPALWIDDYRIFSFNRIGDATAQYGYFFFAAGSKERFNRILDGFHRMETFMNEKKLRWDWHIYHGTHNSYIKKDMHRILYDKILR